MRLELTRVGLLAELANHYTTRLSRLIPKKKKYRTAEETIASLKSKMDVNYVLFNTAKELPVTLEEIKFKTRFGKFIKQTKKLMNLKVKTKYIFNMQWHMDV